MRKAEKANFRHYPAARSLGISKVVELTYTIVLFQMEVRECSRQSLPDTTHVVRQDFERERNQQWLYVSCSET